MQKIDRCLIVPRMPQPVMRPTPNRVKTDVSGVERLATPHFKTRSPLPGSWELEVSRGPERSTTPSCWRVVGWARHPKAARAVGEPPNGNEAALPPLVSRGREVKQLDQVLKYRGCIAGDPGGTQAHPIRRAPSHPMSQWGRSGTGRREPVRVSTVDLEGTRHGQVH